MLILCNFIFSSDKNSEDIRNVGIIFDFTVVEVIKLKKSIS